MSVSRTSAPSNTHVSCYVYICIMSWINGCFTGEDIYIVISHLYMVESGDRKKKYDKDEITVHVGLKI